LAQATSESMMSSVNDREEGETEEEYQFRVYRNFMDKPVKYITPWDIYVVLQILNLNYRAYLQQKKTIYNLKGELLFLMDSFSSLSIREELLGELPEVAQIRLQEQKLPN